MRYPIPLATVRTMILILALHLSCSSAQPTQPQPDIVIYGATSAGIIAAYTASKMGKTVLLIEPSNHIGGLTTGGLGQTDIGNKYAITGLSREFYRRIGKHYGKFEQWTFEPHVAEKVFKQFLDEGKIKWLTQHQLLRIKKEGTLIKEIVVEDVGSSPSTAITISAKMFIDCTYEGDLMAMAGVSYTVGRESNQQYGETWNGVQLLNKHQFPDGVDPYKIPGKPESGLLWGISSEALLPNGSADKKIQTYNFRLCLTNNPKNRIPISKPERYDSAMYDLLLRQLRAYTPDSLNWQLLHIANMPNQKTDINNCGGFSSDMIGMNYDYVEADFKKRSEIVKAHEVYTKGWLYFLGHDKRVPEHLRNEMLTWGYPADEYPTNDHFTPQLYIREARRMVGPYVMTQHNCEGREVVTDGIGMAAYTMDSHNIQRLVVNGMVKNEGDVQVGGFGSYPISYRAIVPKENECANLVVPVCLSASHIAFGSIRMEPVFMVLAQSAAVAASLAIDSQSPIQKVDVQKLQRVLKSNPLADGSTPEILIDNDDPLRVQLTGQWTNDKKSHGRYGPSFSYSDDKNSSAKYIFPKEGKPGKYAVYLYCPSLKDVVRKLDVTLQLEKKGQLTIAPNNYRDEWVLLGQFEVGKSKSQFVQVSSPANEAGFIFADAVLFVPVRPSVN
jgi:FAD dependent oxidoreductase